jgi:hypothetical protein
LARYRKAFGELIQHFIIGGDETCMQDINNNDGQTSITMYRRTGAFFGEQGPTTFLLKGVQKLHGFTDNFLIMNGAAVGSTLTEVAWEAMTSVLVKGTI